jgi:outer membrane protein TolC
MGNMPSVTLVFGRVFLLTVLGIILFPGCTYFLGEDDFPVATIASGSLQKIDTLALKEAEEEISPSDAAEPAPAELVLGLEECRAMVLENNLDLKVQLIEPTLAGERVSEAEATFEATFAADVSYSKTNEPTALTLDTQGSKRDTLTGDLGVTIPLRTGGEISVDLRDFMVDSDSNYSVYNPTYSNNLSASISQPLLRNAGRRASEYAIRLARLDRQITGSQTKLEVIRVLAAVDTAYWRLYASRKLLEVREQQYEQAKALFEETKSFVEVGAKARIELLRTRKGVAEKLEAIIEAENEVRDNERELKQMLNKPGLGMETGTVLIPSTSPDPVRYDIQKEETVARALENRMDLLELELQLARDASTIDYRKNQALPLVSMAYTYNINGLGPKRGDSYELLSENRFADHTVGLQVSIPLGNEAAESQLRQAIYERTQRLASRENKKAQITAEVLEQIDNLEANWQRILAARQTTIYNDELYQAEKRQFELGTATSYDVLDAQTSLADARQSEISAIADYQISLIDLAYATGTLLGAAKVQWEPFVPGE